MKFQNKRLLGIVIGVGLLLLVPFLAMLFTKEVNWSPFDFVVAAVLLLGAGVAVEAALRILKKPFHRLAVSAVILLGLLVVWAELAVGIFGTPFAGS